MRERDGFTLVEVLVAAFVASLVFGFLVSWMAQNLRAVAHAREQQRALQLAEQRAREFDVELRQSGLVEPGIENGEFADPDSDLGWEITIEPTQLPLPEGFDLETSPSPLFEPVGRPSKDEDPPLHRVTVRVFALADRDTDLVAPFVFFGVVPGKSPAGTGEAGTGATGEPGQEGTDSGDGGGGGSGGGGPGGRNPVPQDDRFHGPPRSKP